MNVVMSSPVTFWLLVWLSAGIAFAVVAHAVRCWVESAWEPPADEDAVFCLRCRRTMGSDDYLDHPCCDRAGWAGWD